MIPLPSDDDCMRQALREAQRAGEAGEVPIGAVVVHQWRIIGRGHNRTVALVDPTAHAEMIAITAAATALGSWRLEECTLYVTLEPCPMCAGAVVHKFQRIAQLAIRLPACARQLCYWKRAVCSCIYGFFRRVDKATRSGC